MRSACSLAAARPTHRRALTFMIVSTSTQAVLAQRLARRHEVDDAIGEAHERRDLDRAVELDDLGDGAARLQVAARDLGELRGVAQVHLRVLVDGPVLGLGDDHAAAADAEIERLVEIAILLLEHVAARDAEVGGAVLDVRRHVGVAHDEHAQPVLRHGNDEAPPRARLLGRRRGRSPRA